MKHLFLLLSLPLLFGLRSPRSRVTYQWSTKSTKARECQPGSARG